MKNPQSALEPFQFLMGESPVSTEYWFKAMVPHFRSMIFQSIPSMAVCMGRNRNKAPNIRTPFPERNPDLIDKEAEEKMSLVTEVVSSVRNIRGEMNIPPSKLIDVELMCSSAGEKDLLVSCERNIRDLAKVATLKFRMDSQKPKAAASSVVRGIEVFVPLKGVIDFEVEENRLQKEIKKIENEMARTQKKLESKNFLEKAPPEIVEKEKEKFSRFRDKLEKLRHSFNTIKNIERDM